MEVSRYNFFMPSADGGVVYNGAEGTFTRVDSATYVALRRGQVPDVQDEFKDVLVRGGVLHDGAQKDRIRNQFNLRRFAGTHVNVTLAPTIECNLGCWYCYQNERRYLGVMDGATQDATLNFIDAVTAGKESFNVDWFGGEPLLAADLIERMTDRLLERYGEGEPRYTGGTIITNGLLLDDAKVAMLKRAGITRAQVSVDRLLHEPPKMRGMLTGTGDPSPIVANVLRFRGELEFFIRINLSALPEGELEAMEAELARLGLREISYLARVEDNITECSGPGRNKVMDGGLTRKAFARSKAQFVHGTQAHLDMMQQALTPKQGFCGATTGGLYVVDHRGDVSRCFISAGVTDESIGNVHDLTGPPESGFASGGDADRRWREYTPFDYDTCDNCRVLPLCMGGCSHARVLHDAIRPPCEAIKHNINTYVREIASRLPANLPQP